MFGREQSKVKLINVHNDINFEHTEIYETTNTILKFARTE